MALLCTWRLLEWDRLINKRLIYRLLLDGWLGSLICIFICFIRSPLITIALWDFCLIDFFELTTWSFRFLQLRNNQIWRCNFLLIWAPLSAVGCHLTITLFALLHTTSGIGWFVNFRRLIKYLIVDIVNRLPTAFRKSIFNHLVEPWVISFLSWNRFILLQTWIWVLSLASAVIICFSCVPNSIYWLRSRFLLFGSLLSWPAFSRLCLQYIFFSFFCRRKSMFFIHK